MGYDHIFSQLYDLQKCWQIHNLESDLSAFLVLCLAISPVFSDSTYDRKHKENIKPLVEAGVISLGGPTLASHPAEGEAPNINGSGLLMRGSSIKEIRAILEKDAYATNGVWDLTKVSPHGPSSTSPFCCPCLCQMYITGSDPSCECQNPSYQEIISILVSRNEAGVVDDAWCKFWQLC